VSCWAGCRAGPAEVCRKALKSGHIGNPNLSICSRTKNWRQGRESL